MLAYQDESSISIQYGYEELKGVYLKVSDNRLEFDENFKNESEIIKNSGIDKDGTYLHLFTGDSANGIKVSKETMETYLKRYKIDQHKIDNLFNLLIPKDRNCLVCNKTTKKFCQKCRCSFYCSRECQVSDWKIHKHFCQSLPIPERLKHKLNTVCVYFGENSSNPVFVNIPLKYETDDEGSFLNIITDEFFNKGEKGFTYYQYNPLKRKTINNAIVIIHKDNFLFDGSKENKCIQNVCNGKQAHDWRGPILVTKYKGHVQYINDYMDIDLNDLSDIIDFFLY